MNRMETDVPILEQMLVSVVTAAYRYLLYTDSYGDVGAVTAAGCCKPKTSAKIAAVMRRTKQTATTMFVTTFLLGFFILLNKLLYESEDGAAGTGGGYG